MIVHQALGWLFSVPGASNTILEVMIPYSRMSSIQLLGKVLKICNLSWTHYFQSQLFTLFCENFKFCFCSILFQVPSQFCSQQTAEDMALLAYNRALKLSSPGQHSSISFKLSRFFKLLCFRFVCEHMVVMRVCVTNIVQSIQWWFMYLRLSLQLIFLLVSENDSFF